MAKLKILILGYLPSKSLYPYISMAKKYGVIESDLVFDTDQAHFDASKISKAKYSDVIISEIPHQFKGVHGRNLITIIKQNPNKYPKLHTSCIAGGKLAPLSVSKFEAYLKDSVYFKLNGLGVKRQLVKKETKKKAVVVKPQPKLSKAPRHGTTYQNWLKSH